MRMCELNEAVFDRTRFCINSLEKHQVEEFYNKMDKDISILQLFSKVSYVMVALYYFIPPD